MVDAFTVPPVYVCCCVVQTTMMVGILVRGESSSSPKCWVREGGGTYAQLSFLSCSGVRTRCTVALQRV